jgi:DtxR family transcriptional regulator, Mn-dependent transcriptional regulator
MQDLSATHEDYLETILELEAKNTVARVKDIAAGLAVQSGTVTSALKILSGKGLINYKPYSFITLTLKGKKIAEEVLRHHTVIKDFLQSVLLLDEQTSEDNACKIEHAMDKTAVNRLVQFIEYIHQCPRAGNDWIQNFNRFFTNNAIEETHCADCLDRCIARYKNDQTIPEEKSE